MKRYSYDVRLMLLACSLPAAALSFPKQPWHFLVLALAAGLFTWGVVLRYLRRTGRSTWNGPVCARNFQQSRASKRVLTVLPAICAALIAVLLLFHRNSGLSDGALGLACGILLGISLVALVMVRSRAKSCCGPLDSPHTQQSGTE